MHAPRIAALLALLACACDDASTAKPVSARIAPTPAAAGEFAGSSSCAACHAAEHAAWKDSDHAHALGFEAPPGALAALDAARASVGVPEDESRTIWGWLGRDPLAQPLVEFPGGRYQPLPLGWDARAQQWVALDAPDEAFVGGMQPAAWRSRDACANTQCLFCHTTGFARGYDEARATFASTWREPGIGCEACHGPAAAHVEWQRASRREPAADPALAALRHAKSTAQVDMCGACHARRAELAEGWHAGAALLDHFRPELPGSPAYHADGRVHGEDFEWGSFRQSAMHAAGVRCSDCHEPHGAGLRAQGNALCLRCHSDAFDAPAHTRHARGSAGAVCTACHMPRTHYLERDARADHSFSIPRPRLDAELGVPSACAACHAERSAEWAQAALADVRREPEIVRASAAVKARTSAAERAARASRAVERAREVAALRRGEPIGERTLAALTEAAEPALWRAALAELAAPHAERADVRAALVRALRDADGLVREAAAAALAPAAPAQHAALAALLSDSLAAVRGSAARSLAAGGMALQPAQRAAYERARDERIAALRLGADTADGGLALGTALEDFGDLAGARGAYERALSIDPRHAAVALNLGLVRARLGDREGARVALAQAIGSDPNSAPAHLALGLWFAEAGDPAQAEQLLARAVALDPALPRARYNLALLYWQSARTELAEPLLRAEWAERPTREVRDALAQLLEQTARGAEASALRAVEVAR